MTVRQQTLPLCMPLIVTFQTSASRTENWLRNHLWCLNDPSRDGIDDDDDDNNDDDDDDGDASRSVICNHI